MRSDKQPYKVSASASASSGAEPTREAAAKHEMSQTQITRAQAVWLLVTFLATIFGLPLVQVVRETCPSWHGVNTWSRPIVFDFFTIFPKAKLAFERAEGTFTNRIARANRSALSGIQGFEKDVEDQSLLTETMQPPVQAALTKLLGVGNEQAYIGKDRWLFYRPGIDYVTGAPFLAPSQLRRRVAATAGGSTVQPDPRKAIYQFHQQLASRGIQLVVMPTPVKPTVHPEKFAAGFSELDSPLKNPSDDDLIAELESMGVLVFDPADLILQNKRKGQKAYLSTDTHWLPSCSSWTARELARWIDQRGLLPELNPVGYHRLRNDVENLGDIAVMLRLPNGQKLFKRQQVTIEQVLSEHNELWRPRRSADVLVLGDSFSNIYSLESMGWGESAGFIEQLSYYLQRPLDRIAQNDAGAYATRASLSLELARGRDRLAGKRLVIWQFAARELAWGDWKLLEMRVGERPAGGFLVAPSDGEILVSGRIQSMSAVPRPGSVPYKDQIISLHLVDVANVHAADNSVSGDAQCVVYLWGMRDSRLETPARLREGQRVTLRLQPWSDVSSTLGSIKRSELDDFNLQLEEPNWGEVVQ